MHLRTASGAQNPVALDHTCDLDATEYADACPIATLALEVASGIEELSLATAEVFDAWVAAGTKWFNQWTGDEDTGR